MATTKGYGGGKSVHHLIKKGYTSAHHKNSKKAKYKGVKNPVKLRSGHITPPQLEQGDNDFNLEEQQS